MAALTYDPIVLLDANTYLAGADLTGWGNKTTLGYAVDGKESTTFRARGHTYKGGLSAATASQEGFYQAGDPRMPDDTFWASVGREKLPYTASPEDAAVGGLAYLTRMLQTQYQFTGQVGELLSFTADMQGNWPLARGAYLHTGFTAVTATGNGTAVQLGAVPAGKAMYACLHTLEVTADSGSPTLTVKIQSDDNSGFTSATDRITFSTATGNGGEAMRLVGAVTDTYWRAVWTVAGGATNPSTSFVVSAGIGRK